MATITGNYPALAQILSIENDFLTNADIRFNDFFGLPYDLIGLMTNQIKWNNSSLFSLLCIKFYNVAIQDSMLALLSITRRHQAQAAYNKRSIIESFAMIAYFLSYGKDKDKLEWFNEAIKNKDNKKIDGVLKKEAYSLLEKSSFKKYSDFFLSTKNTLNETLLHAGVYKTIASVGITIENDFEPVKYFDDEDDFVVKHQFFELANMILYGLNLIKIANENSKLLKMSDDFDIVSQRLANRLSDLKAIIKT